MSPLSSIPKQHQESLTDTQNVQAIIDGLADSQAKQVILKNCRHLLASNILLMQATALQVKICYGLLAVSVIWICLILFNGALLNGALQEKTTYLIGLACLLCGILFNIGRNKKQLNQLSRQNSHLEHLIKTIESQVALL